MKLLPIVLLSGCALDVPTLSDVEQMARNQPGDCPTYGCGGNSSGMEGRYATEIHELGQVTPEGMRLIDFGKFYGTAWRSMRADVKNAELLGRDKISNTILLKGPQLAGAMFVIEDTVTLNHYYITVVAAEKTAMWAQFPLPNRETWNYELAYYSDTNHERRNVCMSPPIDDPIAAAVIPMRPEMAVFFDDDRIVHDDIRFDKEEPDWFTIGCAGSALAKQHLSAQTKAGSQIVGATTTLPERTAFLKMMTADYCGAGDAYTVGGTPLHYRDSQGLFSTVQEGERIEGLWGERGVKCIGTPRVELNPTKLSEATFGVDLSDELAAFGCVLPEPCTPEHYEVKYPNQDLYVISTNY